MPRITSPAELDALRQQIRSQRDPDRPCVTLCSGSACLATGSGPVAAAFEQELAAQGLTEGVDLRRTGCHGFCERGPIVVLHPAGTCYFQVTPEDVPEIVAETIKEGRLVERLLCHDPELEARIVTESEIPSVSVDSASPKSISPTTSSRPSRSSESNSYTLASSSTEERSIDSCRIVARMSSAIRRKTARASWACSTSVRRASTTRR